MGSKITKIQREGIHALYDIKEKLGRFSSHSYHSHFLLLFFFSSLQQPARSLIACLILILILSGNFAIVKRAIRRSDGVEVAIKIIRKATLKPKELESIHDEVEIMNRVRPDSDPLKSYLIITLTFQPNPTQPNQPNPTQSTQPNQPNQPRSVTPTALSSSTCTIRLKSSIW